MVRCTIKLWQLLMSTFLVKFRDEIHDLTEKTGGFLSHPEVYPDDFNVFTMGNSRER